MYNPIQIACTTFLTKQKDGAKSQKIERLRALFGCAQKGLERLMETYKTCTIIRLCLSYFHVLIANHVDEVYQDRLFRKDGLTTLYGTSLVSELNAQWTDERLKVVLDLIGFLSGDSMASVNVKSLETIMATIDNQTREIFGKQ
jgi:hypothetical protein